MAYFGNGAILTDANSFGRWHGKASMLALAFKTELETLSNVKNVIVGQLIRAAGPSPRMLPRLNVTFDYMGIGVDLVVSFTDAGISIRSSQVQYSPIYLVDSYTSIESMISAVHGKYVNFLLIMAERVAKAPLVKDLNRKQDLLMRQTALIEAGFNVEIGLLPDDQFCLIITHEHFKEEHHISEKAYRSPMPKLF